METPCQYQFQQNLNCHFYSLRTVPKHTFELNASTCHELNYIGVLFLISGSFCSKG